MGQALSEQYRKQVVTTRSCILISLKDKTEYPFPSLADADAFLDRKHGYVSGKIRDNKRPSCIHDDGTIELFDVIVGAPRRTYSAAEWYSNQPCWTCKKCYGDCSWSACFKPIPGWTAKPSYKDGDVTYSIKYCPEYDPEKKERKNVYSSM